MPSERQIGLKGEREPDLCAVTGRDVRGKHAVTHYGPNGQYVYVLSQVDHLWPKAAPAYGFPVPEDAPTEEEDVFVLPADDNDRIVSPTGDNGVTTSFQGDFLPSGRVESLPRQQLTPKSPLTATRPPTASDVPSDIKADGMSKGDD